MAPKRLFTTTPLIATALSTEAQQDWGRTGRNAVAAVEAMPEEHYYYKPTPESQSFGDLVVHRRLNGVVPPPASSRVRGPGGGGKQGGHRGGQ